MVGVVQLLLCVALVAETLSFEPVTDSPYIEYVSHRILNPSSPPVADWPTLPFDAVDSVAAQFGQEHGALLLGTNGELGWLHGVVEGAPPKISLITVSGSSGVTIRAVVSASGIVYTIQVLSAPWCSGLTVMPPERTRARITMHFGKEQCFLYSVMEATRCLEQTHLSMSG